MNKFTKFCLITASICVLLGLVLFTVGSCFGGFSQAANMAENGELSIGPDSEWGIHIADFNSDLVFDNTFETFSGDYTNQQIATIDQVNGLDVELGGGQLVIRTSDTDFFQVKSENTGKFQCYVNDGTLYLKGLKNNITFGTNRNIIYLYVPAGTTFDNADIDLGGGTIEADTINVSSLKVKLGAGSFTADTIAADSVNIEVGAGSVEVDNGNTTDATFDVGMGEIIWNGSIKNNLDAQCSMGSLELTLDGNEQDHDYDIECSMGDVTVGNNSYEGMATDRKIDNGSDSIYTIDCSMGSVQITF